MRLAFAVLMLAAATHVADASPAYFRYAGIALEDFDFAERFPASRVLDGYVRLSEADSRGHVYYVSRSSTAQGLELRMVFEKPEEYVSPRPTTWKAGHYARFPPCAVVLSNLVNRYGQPSLVDDYAEERLAMHVRQWSHGDETMKLVCYRIDGRGKALAAELWIARGGR